MLSTQLVVPPATTCMLLGAAECQPVMHSLLGLVHLATRNTQHACLASLHTLLAQQQTHVHR